MWYLQFNKLSCSRKFIVNNKNKHLAVLKDDQEFVTQNGVIKFNDIKELPSVINSSNNHEYHVYIPSFEEFILLMKRGPQIIYPKDIGSILIAGNINKNSNILEIGTGSGALTLYLNLILDKESISGFWSTPITFPSFPTIWAQIKAFLPLPLPRSKTISFFWTYFVGSPHP